MSDPEKAGGSIALAPPLELSDLPSSSSPGQTGVNTIPTPNTHTHTTPAAESTPPPQFNEKTDLPTEVDPDQRTIDGSESSQATKRVDPSTPGEKDQKVFNEKQTVPQDVRLGSSSSSSDHGEKKVLDSNENVVELDGEKVFLGTEALTGKAIIKDKKVLTGGPYTVPAYYHSLPFMKPKNPPPPPPDSMDDAKPLPDAQANWLSLLLFYWIQPIMALGASRQLAPEDLYKMTPDREASFLSQKLQACFQKRWEAADSFNIALENGTAPVPRKKRWQWALGRGEEKGKTKKEKEEDWRARTGKRKPDLAWALSDVFGWYFWSAGFIKVSRTANKASEDPA